MICKIIGHNIVSRETILICSRCGKSFKVKNKLAEIILEEIKRGEEYLKQQLETIMDQNNGCKRVKFGATMEYEDTNAMNNLRSQIGILKEIIAKWRES
jgi:hypothetical protein